MANPKLSLSVRARFPRIRQPKISIASKIEIPALQSKTFPLSLNNYLRKNITISIQLGVVSSMIEYEPFLGSLGFAIVALRLKASNNEYLYAIIQPLRDNVVVALKIMRYSQICHAIPNINSLLPKHCKSSLEDKLSTFSTFNPATPSKIKEALDNCDFIHRITICADVPSETQRITQYPVTINVPDLNVFKINIANSQIQGSIFPQYVVCSRNGLEWLTLHMLGAHLIAMGFVQCDKSPKKLKVNRIILSPTIIIQVLEAMHIDVHSFIHSQRNCTRVAGINFQNYHEKKAKQLARKYSSVKKELQNMQEKYKLLEKQLFQQNSRQQQYGGINNAFNNAKNVYIGGLYSPTKNNIWSPQTSSISQSFIYPNHSANSFEHNICLPSNNYNDSNSTWNDHASITPYNDEYSPNMKQEERKYNDEYSPSRVSVSNIAPSSMITAAPRGSVSNIAASSIITAAPSEIINDIDLDEKNEEINLDELKIPDLIISDINEGKVEEIVNSIDIAFPDEICMDLQTNLKHPSVNSMGKSMVSKFDGNYKANPYIFDNLTIVEKALEVITKNTNLSRHDAIQWITATFKLHNFLPAGQIMHHEPPRFVFNTEIQTKNGAIYYANCVQSTSCPKDWFLTRIKTPKEWNLEAYPIAARKLPQFNAVLNKRDAGFNKEVTEMVNTFVGFSNDSTAHQVQATLTEFRYFLELGLADGILQMIPILNVHSSAFIDFVVPIVVNKVTVGIVFSYKNGWNIRAIAGTKQWVKDHHMLLGEDLRVPYFIQNFPNIDVYRWTWV